LRLVLKQEEAWLSAFIGPPRVQLEISIRSFAHQKTEQVYQLLVPAMTSAQLGLNDVELRSEADDEYEQAARRFTPEYLGTDRR